MRAYLIFSFFGVFNVTAMASNMVTNGSVTHTSSIIVSSKPCKAPTVAIPFNATNNRAPEQYSRTDAIQISTLATLNCSGILTTK